MAAAGPPVDLPGAMGIYISEVVWFNVRPLTFLLWGGVFERFPRLRIAYLEGGAGWVPYLMDRLDEEVEKRARETAP